jgi:hypothetical protein
MTITYGNGTVVEVSDGLLMIALIVLAPTVFVLACIMAETISSCVKQLVRRM